jgi:betaine-aldehyde dehydrogenase
MNNAQLAEQSKIVAFVPRQLYYAGTWHPAVGGSTAEPLSSPSPGVSLGEVMQAGAEDVDRAVRAAHEAFYQWRAVKPLDRARLLRELASLLRGHAQELALIDGRGSHPAMWG